MHNPPTLTVNIDALRAEGSNAELARITGLDPSTISRVMRGGSPSTPFVGSIIAAFGAGSFERFFTVTE
ncbi:MAG: helix-turn-helix domain-containing protein [Mycobacterium sp.]|nr:helix-turn-helix domain-containing protein [Mycobacterium sp.]